MDTAQKVARLLEIAEMIEVAAKDYADITGNAARDLAWWATVTRDRASSIERRAKPIAIGDAVEVSSLRGYKAVTIRKVGPAWVTTFYEPWNREERYRRGNGDIHPDDLARIDACFPRKVKP